MSSLPVLPGPRVARALERLGFEKIRQRGSHAFYRHADGRCTVVPIHANKDLPRGTLAKILKDCQVSIEELTAFL